MIKKLTSANEQLDKRVNELKTLVDETVQKIEQIDQERKKKGPESDNPELLEKDKECKKLMQKLHKQQKKKEDLIASYSVLMNQKKVPQELND